MTQRLLAILIVLLGLTIHAQEVTLPPDFRQHNLTEYNSSLLSPVFSADRNNPESVALWARWQWQSIDADPTTLFLNYTRRLNEESTAAAGFFQNNTGSFLLTGGILNYAYTLELKSNAQIAFGLNMLGYSKKLADERFQPDPDIGLPALDDSSSFILQLAPSLRFKINRFSIGIAAENLIDYNFSTSEKESEPTKKTYIGLASYAFPISNDAELQPTVYLKTIPEFDNQIGFNALYTTSKFWLQGGYNNFYGISGGAGGRFYKRLSIGVLMEFGTDAALEGLDPSIELVTAYKLGAVGDKEQEEEVIAEEEKEILPEEQDEARPLADVTEPEMTREEARAAKRAEKLEEREAAKRLVQQQRDSVKATTETEMRETEVAQQQRVLDSIAAVKREDAIAASTKEQDSLVGVKAKDAVILTKKVEDSVSVREEVAVQPRKGEKYEETEKVDGLQPGYYLIANVFATKIYFDKFMKSLSAKGLQPKSFFTSANKYNYVYLDRYNTLQEARDAIDSKLGGKYPDKIWIFRVVGK